jgi:ataxia telangiectasia mutated family protein
MHKRYFVQELEPFPELKIFDEIRKFHEELCHTYSIRDHILKVKNYNLLAYL